ncbi:MAG: hypothetical protein A2687_00390 [Candidatus Levybacteria bacterium RIFCSPHIGHO2_01_FULL_38_26]|nr:MAG: hypothetical protein A2687_00390 [Candidatus Levybacteria bacterium RIFCSPHIGHO2_01_FULL_38_26]
MTFLGDEGRDVLVVYNMLHGDLTLLGPAASVGGFFLGPIYYYFMAPFLLLFNFNPVGPAVMVALFGIATVWLVYRVGSEFFGSRAGLIAAAIYGISPLVIAYSRSSWNPNPMPFFSLLFLYILYKAVNRNKIILFAFCGILLGILMQLHYLATFLGVIAGVYILISRIYAGRAWRTLKDYFFVFLGFVVGWLPFLLFEIRHGFQNFQSIINFIFQSGDTGASARFFETIYDVFFRLFGRLVTNFPPPEQVALGAHPNMAAWYYATLILGIASVSIFLLKFYKNFRERNSEVSKYVLILTWLVLGIGLFGFYNKPIYDYYFGFMFPLPFLLVGLFISSMLTKKIGKFLSIGVLAILLWVNFQGIPFRYTPNRQLAQVEEISRFVVDKTDGKPFNFALITGSNSDHAYRYFFTVWDRHPLTIENPQKDPQRKTVTDQLMVVCETNPCAPLGNSLWEIAGFGRAEIAGEWNVSVVKVYKLIHYK